MKAVVTPTITALLKRGPDLTVSVSGPRTAGVGTEVSLKITVTNKGTTTAPGTTSNATAGYFVDLVLSSDGDIPLTLGVWPGYAGKTEHDFLEDMLLRGGRISNTQSLRPGQSATYTLAVPVPKRTPHGVYCIGAFVDPADKVRETREDNNIYCHRILVGPREDGPVQAPAGVWIMPYAVGDTKLFGINAAGRTTYRDSLSGLMMNDAPFGSRLGFRHGYEQSIPNRQIKYYRWLYKEPGATTFQEFDESVGVHYVKEQGGKVSFPVYLLGPKSVGANTLYEFRPPKPPTITGATTYWPTNNWFGDIYSGFLKSHALPDGTYTIKLEAYSPAGALVRPGTAFRFIVPRSVAANGTITTRPANRSEQDATGFIFKLRVDNRHCSAFIAPPSIAGVSVADICGFLLYTNRNTQRVSIAFRAAHPENEARFHFRIIRGANTVTATVANGEVSAATAGVYTGSGTGVFSHDFRIPELLGPQCPEKAAFSENLHVYAKATTGWRQRINSLDARDVRAFALAPK